MNMYELELAPSVRGWNRAGPLHSHRGTLPSAPQVLGMRDLYSNQARMLFLQERERDTDKCILFEIQAGIEPAIPIHLAYSIDTLKL